MKRMLRIVRIELENAVALLASHIPKIAVTLLFQFLFVITNKINTTVVTNILSLSIKTKRGDPKSKNFSHARNRIK
jgi:hypothetical protein